MGIPGKRPNVETTALAASHRNLPDPQLAGGNIVRLDAPGDLSDEAVEIWELVVPDLLELKILRTADIPLLIEMIESLAYSRRFRKGMDHWQKELDRLLTDGYDAERDVSKYESMKEYVQHVDMVSQLVKRERAGYIATLGAAHRLSGDLGVGPVTRIRIGLGKLQGQSLMDALNARHDSSGTSE